VEIIGLESGFSRPAVEYLQTDAESGAPQCSLAQESARDEQKSYKNRLDRIPNTL
jgi:hypothetical protein